MTGLDVLAQALHASSDVRGEWDRLPPDLQDQWRDRARVVRRRMDEADGISGQPVAQPDGRYDPLAGMTLEQAVELAVAAAGAVQFTAAGGRTEDTPTLLGILQQLRHTKWLLDETDASICRHLYLTSEHGKRVVDGVGQVAVYRTRSKEKWDTQGVARAVVDARMEDRGGEVPDDPWEVAEWLLEVLGVQYVRKTALDTLGIPRDPFYDSEPGSIRVDVPRLTG